ncbi:MAG TPA: hypothetical protein VGC55_06145 [Dokdonella sp.]
MPVMVCTLAVAITLASALAAYARSAHCRWPALRRLHRAGGMLGAALAGIAWVLWSAALGFGAGVCALLSCWMLGAIVLPYLAWISTAGAAAEHR